MKKRLFVFVVNFSFKISYNKSSKTHTHKQFVLSTVYTRHFKQ